MESNNEINKAKDHHIPDASSDHTPPEMVLQCNSLPDDPEKRTQMIEKMKARRDEIIAQRKKNR